MNKMNALWRHSGFLRNLSVLFFHIAWDEKVPIECEGTVNDEQTHHAGKSSPNFIRCSVCSLPDSVIVSNLQTGMWNDVNEIRSLVEHVPHSAEMKNHS